MNAELRTTTKDSPLGKAIHELTAFKADGDVDRLERVRKLLWFAKRSDVDTRLERAILERNIDAQELARAAAVRNGRLSEPGRNF